MAATNSVKAFVTLTHGGGTIKYGYNIRKTLFTSLKTKLGITEVTDTANILFGINSPKPWRAKKIDESTGVTESSWCSDNKVASLQKEDAFVLTPPKSSIRSATTNPNYTTVYIELPVGGGGFIKYAWNMKKDLLAAAQTPLGINVVSASDLADLVWGINSPTPPRATKRINGRFRSTFMTAKASVLDKASAAGWAVQLGAYEAIDDTAP